MTSSVRLLALSLALILGVVALVLPSPVAACDFEEPPAPDIAFEEAHAVFTGEVVSIEPVDDDPSEQFDAATFAVDRAWKGIDSTPVTVETHQDEATCGYPFEQGESYLVYAHGGDTYLTTALYHRTSPLDRAEEDLEVLGTGTEVTAQAENRTDADDGFNPGVAILLIVIISIILATVMLLRQSKPSMPDDYDDTDDNGTSENRGTSSR